MTGFRRFFGFPRSSALLPPPPAPPPLRVSSSSVFVDFLFHPRRRRTLAASPPRVSPGRPSTSPYFPSTSSSPYDRALDSDGHCRTCRASRLPPVAEYKSLGVQLDNIRADPDPSWDDMEMLTAQLGVVMGALSAVTFRPHAPPVVVCKHAHPMSSTALSWLMKPSQVCIC